MNGMDLMGALLGLIPVILSLSVHEWAHAWSAHKLGDDTAERVGRLTLNPAAHIDPFGTIILPVVMTLSHLPAFGWARPVPIDPSRFRRDVSMARGMALTASAGPIANVLLAVVSTVLLGIMVRQSGAGDVATLHGAGQEALDAILRIETVIRADPKARFLATVIELNVVLAVFNLIPIPPLDGSRVVAWLLPPRLQAAWHRAETLAPIFLIVVFMFGGRLISGPVDAFDRLLFRLLTAIVRGPTP